MKVFCNSEKHFHYSMKNIIGKNVRKVGWIQWWEDLDMSLNLNSVMQTMRHDENV